MNPIDEHERLLRSFAIDLKLARKSPATIGHYTEATRAFAKWWGKPLEKAKPADIKDYMLWMDESLSKSTVRNRFAGLRAFYKWAVVSSEFDTDPTRNIPVPPRPDVQKAIVTVDDVLLVLRLLEKEKNFRDAAVVALLYETGIRSRNLCELRARDINWKDETIQLSDTKTKVPVTVPLGGYTQKYLLRILREVDGDEYVFRTRTGRPFTRSTLWDVVQKAFAKAGIKAHPHLMRHSAASALALAGMDSKDLDVLFGWSDPRTSLTYTRQVASQRAVKKSREFHPLMRKP